MSSAFASRDGASSVAAGTPKKGTKAASRMPKSMSGRLKKPSPRRMARNSALPASSREKISASPRRSRPAPQRPVEHGVALALVDRDAPLAGTAAPRRRRRRGAMKCGTIHITGLSLRSAKRDVALDADQPAQPRRRRVPEQAALEQAASEPAEMLAGERLARAGVQLGKAELEVAHARRGGATPPRASRSRPRPWPSQRLQRRAAAIGTATGRQQSRDTPSARRFSACASWRRRPVSIGAPPAALRCGDGSRRPQRLSGLACDFPIIRPSPSY